MHAQSHIILVSFGRKRSIDCTRHVYMFSDDKHLPTTPTMMLFPFIKLSKLGVCNEKNKQLCEHWTYVYIAYMMTHCILGRCSTN